MLILRSNVAAALPNYQECVSPIARNYQHCNTSLSHAERVEALISVMSMEEKVLSLAPDPAVGHDCNVVTKPIPRLGLGRFMWLTETNSQANSVCLNGTRCATAFPGQLGLASSFNRTVWFSKGDVISTELRALYNSGGQRRCNGCFVGLTGFGPNINIARDPRFGRTSELPGEDPYLNGEYAVEYVRGMQQTDDRGYLKMMAFLKHYTAYSHEAGRGSDTYNISLHDYFDTYFPQFEAGLVRAGASGVMCSYNGENGRPSCANDFILNHVMREKWKRHDSIDMTDCGAVSNMLGRPANAPTPEHAVSWTLGNGTDVEAGTHMWVDHLINAVHHKLIDESVIDEALRRVYVGMMKVGRFDDPSVVSWSSIAADSIGSEEHRKIRDDAARQSSTLLRNLGCALPLQPGQTVVVVGPQANDGSGYLPDYFGDEVCPRESAPFDCIPSVYQSIRKQNVKGSTFLFQGVDEKSTDRTEHYDHALAAVSNLADVVVLAMGISRDSEQEGIDRTETSLPGLQNDFALDVLSIAAERDIVAVLLLTNGGALSIDDLLPLRNYSSVYNADKSTSLAGKMVELPACYKSGGSAAPMDGLHTNLPRKYAVVEAYNPSLGMAPVVQALFGVGPISWGRLVTTIYPKKWAETHAIDQYDFSAGDGLTYRYYKGIKLATFGEGMPSEHPSNSRLQCSLKKEDGVPNKWTVICDASNNGDRPLSALMMVYVRASDRIRNSVPYPIPLRALRGFDRVMLNAGETNLLSAEINLSDLMLINSDGHKEADPGRHFDIIDIWDGWNAFASFSISIDFNGIGIPDNEKIGGGVLLKSH